MTVQLPLFSTAPSSIDAAKLPTNLTTRRHAVHRWINFTAGYSPEFVLGCIDREATRGLVLDPFAGMGTTLVAANSIGLPAVGFDPHPHAAMMTRAKTQTRSLEAVEQVEAVLELLEPVATLESIWSEAQIKFLSKVVSNEEELRKLASARVLESSLAESHKPLFRLAVTRLLEGVSGSATDGIYKAPTSKKRARTVSELLPGLMQVLYEDVSVILEEDWASSEVFEATSEDMSVLSSESVSHVITSPPYLNNFDFAEMSRMELYFWGYADSWRVITETVRRKLIVNTTTAPTDFKKDQERWREQLSGAVLEATQGYVHELTVARSERVRSKDYERLVFPYFAQMQSVLRECYRVMRSGAALDLVVSDAALYGIHIHAETVLRDLMLQCGFVDIDIVRLRSRGDRWVLAKRMGSKEPLGEFHIIARKGLVA